MSKKKSTTPETSGQVESAPAPSVNPRDTTERTLKEMSDLVLNLGEAVGGLREVGEVIANTGEPKQASALGFAVTTMADRTYEIYASLLEGLEYLEHLLAAKNGGAA